MLDSLIPWPGFVFRPIKQNMYLKDWHNHKHMRHHVFYLLKGCWRCRDLNVFFRFEMKCPVLASSFYFFPYIFIYLFDHFVDFIFFFLFIFTSWRLITLQYCSGFCHTLTWISHGSYMYSPSHLPLYPIPLGLPSAPGPSTCLMHPTWAGDLFHHR